MERLPAPAMPATLTAEALRRWLSHDTLPLVEIQSLDMGYYIVPFHHREGVLTWAEGSDAMVGLPSGTHPLRDAAPGLRHTGGLHDPVIPMAWRESLAW
ncbi:hypothetical protein [Halomonas rhizosphaerae]|uniref:AraC family transcriptional regulator n=1 Tax=Halomonas rhizosphaerae TaxID=3043296 RepID=A0ABT6V302_9GAMM|nr:hypothetical protein [Halomonas rhizosphaerae]MDI5892190.1 hypothetical protein [Halomonas rhizosphaerae]